MLDISKQAVAETAAIHIRAADGTHLYDENQEPVRIIVYGPGSKAAAAIESRIGQRTLKRFEENENKPSLLSPEERRRETAEDLAVMTVRFENFTYAPAAGKDGAELFQALYADPTLGFITAQVSKFVGNWGGFKPGSPPV